MVHITAILVVSLPVLVSISVYNLDKTYLSEKEIIYNIRKRKIGFIESVHEN